MANAFIVCCGGIENARVLLNCTRDFPNGLGNQHDLVGRFFMDHLGAIVGVIIPQHEIQNFGPLQKRHDTVGALMNSAETVRQVAEIIKGHAPVGAVNAESWTRRPGTTP